MLAKPASFVPLADACVGNHACIVSAQRRRGGNNDLDVMISAAVASFNPLLATTTQPQLGF